MSNFRDATLRVEVLKQETNAAIENIKRHGITIVGGRYQLLPSAEKKLKEAQAFLETINQYEYSGCTTIYNLCNHVQKIIGTLKIELIKTENISIPLQTGIFRDYRIDSMRVEKENKIARLKAEISWLERCIVIIKNRNYFNY